jgi:hypothetical protein
VVKKIGNEESWGRVKRKVGKYFMYADYYVLI